MGARQSSNSRPTSYAGPGHSGMGDDMGGASGMSHGGRGSVSSRERARSLGSIQSSSNGHLRIPAEAASVLHAARNYTDSDTSTPDEDEFSYRTFLQASSLPVQLFSLQGIKCPVCGKMVQADDMECHLVMCLTKPRINYNEDVLVEDKGECVICFEELQGGQTIARLPCLCIYHKVCIDGWFRVNRSCPEHPED